MDTVSWKARKKELIEKSASVVKEHLNTQLVTIKAHLKFE